jgi:hypothetical protein
MLLVADIRPYYSFIKSDRKNKIPWSRVTSVQESDVMPLKTTPMYNQRWLKSSLVLVVELLQSPE